MGRGGRGSLQPEHGSHRAGFHGRRRVFSGWGYQGRRCVSSSIPSMDPKYPITNTQLPPNYHPITDQLLTNLPYRCRGVGRANGRVRVRIPGVTRGRRHGGPGGHRSGPGRARASRNQSFKRLFIIEQFKSGIGADRVERAGRWTRAPVGRAHGPEGNRGGARRARRRGHRRQSVPKRASRKRRRFLHR